MEMSTNSILNNSRPIIRTKKKGKTILIPFKSNEKTLIHNVSTKLGLQKNNISSSMNKKNSFSFKKNNHHSSLPNIHQKQNIEKENNKDNENITKKTHYNILVAIRCRPLSQREKEISQKETIQIINKKIIKLKDPNGFLNPNNVRSKEQILEFDYAFDNKDSQETIFNNTTKPLIDGIINGFNATVFAYGATGAGKTYTMLGNDENPGIMPLTFGELFKEIKKYSNREYTIKLCYLEIYNENIKDLLINNGPNLELREDPNKGLFINGITEIITKSGEHILSILKKGNKNRTTEATNANQTSSRSHAILQIIVSYKEKINENDNKNNINNNIKYGKLSLIDLAGSERASVTKNKGMRLFEGANINKSLLTLGNCINALSEYNVKGTKSHIPYRDSKLTRLLKDSLGGNSRTVMIANISPFIYSFDDTYNTLNYADRAKHIKTRVKVNIAGGNKSNINNYLNVIKHLQNKVNLLETKLNNKNNDNNNDNDNDLLLKETEKNTEENHFEKKRVLSKSLEKNIQRKKKNENIISNIYMNDINKILDKKNIGDIIEKNEKKINNIIEEYIQLSKAEVQIKQKVMGIQYDIFNLNNKIINNESFFPISLSSSFTQRGKSEKTKLRSLTKILDKNISLLNDISQKTENILKKYTENNNNEESIIMNDLQKNYISLINKNSGIQKENIEIKYNNAIIKLDLDKKDNYIKELIKQIELRDSIIQNKIIETKNIEEEKDLNKEIKKLMNQRQKIEYLTLEELEDKYFLLDNKKNPNYTLNKNTSFSSTHNYTSRYQKNKYSLRPRNASFIQKRDLITKQVYNFDDSPLLTDNIIYNESENNNYANVNNSGLNIGINYIYTNRGRNINQYKNKDNKLFVNISNRKDNILNEYKNKLNIGPVSLNNIENYNSEIKDKKGMFNFNQNFINSSEDDEKDNNEDNDSIENENENDVTLQSMLNDIEVMNSEIKSKFNILENSSNIKNSNNNNFNNNIKQFNINAKKNKIIDKKNNIKSENLNNKKKNIFPNNKNKNNNLKNIDNKIANIEIDKNNLITKNTNQNNKNTNNQIYVNRNLNNLKNSKNVSKKNSFAPIVNEINNQKSSLIKSHTKYPKDSSSTQKLSNFTTKKNLKNKKERNSSMTNIIIKIKDKTCLTNKNYDTNNDNEENSQNKKLNRSLIISDDKKITLDTLMNEAKKRYNKKKLENNNKNSLTNEDNNINIINQNQKKLQQFYEEHLNKNNNKNLNNMNNKKNIIDNNNEFYNINDIHKTYDINVINNQKNSKFDSKEKGKNYDKLNVNLLMDNNIKKKDNK